MNETREFDRHNHSRSKASALGRESLIMSGYLLYAVLMSYPLIKRLTTYIGGAGGDGPRFLWNYWWFTQTVPYGKSPLFTDLLFYPLGTSLVFHTLTLFHSFLAYPFSFCANWMLINNVIYLFGGAFGAWAAYRLIYSLVDHRPAALVGGLLFGFCPYHSLRGFGHFNLAATYIIPLTLWGVTTALRRSSFRVVIVAGGSLGIAVYIDYYYAVYSVLAAMLLFLYLPILQCEDDLRFTWVHRLGTISWWLGILFLVLIAISSIGSEHGYPAWFTMGFLIPKRLMLAGILLRLAPLAKAWRVVRFRLTIAGPLTRLMLIGIIGLAIAAPLLWPILRPQSAESLITPLRYFSETYSADVLSFITPPPAHSLAHDHFSFLLGEGTGGIELWTYQGILPLLAGIIGFYVNRRRSYARFWGMMAISAAVLALGPILHVGGQILHPVQQNSVFTLPYLQFMKLPLMGGIRVPSRIAILTNLSLATLAAEGLVRIRRRWLANGMILGLAILATLDYALLPYDVQKIESPAMLGAIARDNRLGISVLDLPLEISGGVKLAGSPNPMMFYRQTIHHHPLIGGHVSRLGFFPFQYYQQTRITAIIAGIQRGNKATFEDSTEFRSNVRLQADELRIGYALLDQMLITGEKNQALQRFLEDQLGFQFIAAESGIQLWRNPHLLNVPDDKFSVDLTNEWDQHKNVTPYSRTSEEGLELLDGAVKLIGIISPAPFPYSLSFRVRCSGDDPRLVRVKVNQQDVGTVTITSTMTDFHLETPRAELWPGVNTVSLMPESVPAGVYPIGATGISSDKPCRVLSTFYDLHKPPFLKIGDQAALQPGKGLNLVVLDPATMKILSTMNYSTSSNQNRPVDLDAFLDRVPAHAIVLLSLCDNGNLRISKHSRQLLAELGGSKKTDQWLLGAYALIGVMGAAPGTAVENIDAAEAFVEVPASRMTIKSMSLQPHKQNAAQ